MTIFAARDPGRVEAYHNEFPTAISVTLDGHTYEVGQGAWLVFQKDWARKGSIMTDREFNLEYKPVVVVGEAAPKATRCGRCGRLVNQFYPRCHCSP